MIKYLMYLQCLHFSYDYFIFVEHKIMNKNLCLFDLVKDAVLLDQGTLQTANAEYACDCFLSDVCASDIKSFNHIPSHSCSKRAAYEVGLL